MINNDENGEEDSSVRCLFLTEGVSNDDVQVMTCAWKSFTLAANTKFRPGRLEQYKCRILACESRICRKEAAFRVAHQVQGRTPYSLIKGVSSRRTRPLCSINTDVFACIVFWDLDNIQPKLIDSMEDICTRLKVNQSMQ